MTMSYENGEVLRNKKIIAPKITEYADFGIMNRDDCISGGGVVGGGVLPRFDYDYCVYNNSSEVNVIEYVKCWNGTEDNDPDLIEVENSFDGKGDYASTIYKGTRVVQLASNYYWKTIKEGPFPDGSPGETCNRSMLNQERAVLGTTYKCVEK